MGAALIRIGFRFGSSSCPLLGPRCEEPGGQAIMSGEREITVISRNYDLSIRRKWKGRLIRHSLPLIELVGEFDRDVAHPELGIISRGTLSYEYYWLDRWYNVFRFDKPCGELRSYYCNINMPPKFEGDVIDYVDLDID